MLIEKFIDLKVYSLFWNNGLIYRLSVPSNRRNIDNVINFDSMKLFWRWTPKLCEKRWSRLYLIYRLLVNSSTLEFAGGLLLRLTHLMLNVVLLSFSSVLFIQVNTFNYEKKFEKVSCRYCFSVLTNG